MRARFVNLDDLRRVIVNPNKRPLTLATIENYLPPGLFRTQGEGNV
jgi:hypothetical protein